MIIIWTQSPFFVLFTMLQPPPKFAGVAPVLQEWIQDEKCLGTLKLKSPVAPARVVSSRNECSCKTRGSVAGSQCWPWGAVTALSREGKAKPPQHFHAHSHSSSKALFPPTWADLHTLWALHMQNWWRRQCFSWLQFKRLSAQVTEEMTIVGGTEQ